MRRNTSFPVSAQECAASATMDADPVSAAAIDFARASSPLATSATSTVNSDELVPWSVDVSDMSFGTPHAPGTTVAVRALALAVVLAVTPLTAGCDDSGEAEIHRYVAMGDSYTSGTGL